MEGLPQFLYVITHNAANLPSGTFLNASDMFIHNHVQYIRFFSRLSKNNSWEYSRQIMFFFTWKWVWGDGRFIS